MQKFGCFIVLALCAFFFGSSFSQEFVDLRFIDAFDKTTSTLVITIPNDPVFPISVEGTTTGTFEDGIFGNERNLVLTALEGNPTQVVSSGINSDSRYASTTPPQAAAISMVQYDGADDSSVLDPGGLFNVNGLNTDLTINNAFTFHMFAEADIPTNVIFRVYSGSASDYCTMLVLLPGDDTVHEYFLDFDDFDMEGNGCDFTNVGAIEVEVDMFENVDVIIQYIALYGPIISPTPTRTPTSSPSPVGSRSPSPSPTGVCNCICPNFFCEVLRVDDGDYYYFFDVNFFDPAFFSYFFAPYYFTNFFVPGFFYGYFYFFTPYYYFFTTYFYYFDFFFFPNFFDIWYGIYFFG